MKLAISNIAWDNEYDELMYEFLREQKIDGIEIAPTRIFPNQPYIYLNEAQIFKNKLKEKYNLDVCSMQSIWFGKTEKVFGNTKERNLLLDYTKQAILFAEHIGCHNLVFGSPKNRNMDKEEDIEIAINFFRELGDFAYAHNTVLSLEANPVIYDTNFLNTTKDAIDLAKIVNSKGLLVNLDLGTCIYNQENIDDFDYSYIHHIHISEPYLKKIQWQELHRQLKNRLIENQYKNFISIEMGNIKNIDKVREIVINFKKMFRGVGDEI